MSIPAPACLLCRHFDRERTRTFHWPTCAAFGPFIPQEILSGLNRHTAPYPGDKGIRFGPRKDVASANAQAPETKAAE